MGSSKRINIQFFSDTGTFYRPEWKKANIWKVLKNF